LNRYDLQNATYTQFIPPYFDSHDTEDQNTFLARKELFNRLVDLKAESMTLMSEDRLCFIGPNHSGILFVNSGIPFPLVRYV